MILGGLRPGGSISSTDDLNNYLTTGCYNISSQYHPANSPSDIQSTTSFVLIVIASGMRKVQVIYSLSGGFKFRIKHDNGLWYGWF